MLANLKLVLRSYTSLYGILMSASLTLFSYTAKLVLSIIFMRMVYTDVGGINWPEHNPGTKLEDYSHIQADKRFCNYYLLYD